MRVAVNSHALHIYKKNRIASLLCIFETIIEPDFPCLADEIAEPRPDMNIKFAAFTVREKSFNTNGTLAREDEAFAARYKSEKISGN